MTTLKLNTLNSIRSSGTAVFALNLGFALAASQNVQARSGEFQ